MRQRKIAVTKAREKVREEPGREVLSTVHHCARHTKRRSTAWSKFGAAAGRHLCDDCHDHLVKKCLRDPDFVEAVNGVRGAERALTKALEEVAG